MMRKSLILCAFVLLPALLCAQNVERIKEDPAFIWAEGWGSRPSIADKAALDGLVRKLAATEELPVENAVAVWQTFLPDIRTCSVQQTLSSGAVLRYIAWKDIPSIFDARWRKVRELTRSALQAEQRGDRDVARTYCDWATVYLMSLPAGESDLRDRVASLRHRLGAGRTDAVRMRNVETELAGIRAALGLSDRSARPGRLQVPRNVAVDSVRQASRPAWTPVPVLTRPPGLSGNTLPVPQKTLTVPDVRSVPEPLPAMALHPKWSVLAVAEIGRISAWGALLVYSSVRFGGYVSARSNFVAGQADYACRSDGTTDFGYIWASGAARGSRLSLSGGGVVRLADFLRLHAGAGFGQVSVLWEDSSGRWARVSDQSTQGVLLESGLLFQFGHFTAGLGVSNIHFRDWSAMVSAGLNF